MIKMLSASIAAIVLAAGCGATTTTTGTATAAASEQESVPAGGERTGTVPTSAPSGTAFSFKAQSGTGDFDFAAYDDAIDLALGAINEYWIETMPAEFGTEWIDPGEFIAYYPPEQDGPTCGGQPVGPENAVYCSQADGDYIAWDEPGLMVPYYEQFGDMANAVILAHEFGHGAQARLGLSDQFPLTIESELQADCFAGAWAGWADEQGLLGAEYYARNPLVPLKDTVANINIDSMNVLGQTTDITPLGADRSTLGKFLEEVAKEKGLTISPDAHPEQGSFYRSDHFPFAKAGIPAVNFEPGSKFVGHSDKWGEEQFEDYNEHRYHQPSDEFSPNWDFGGMVQQGRLAFLLGLRVANANETPQWNKGDEFERARMKTLGKLQ